MKRLLVMAPLMLTACAGSWPAQSYVQMSSQTDASVLALATGNCVAEVVPPRTAVSLPASLDPMASVLADVLARNGLTVQPDGAAVQYVVAPLDAGEFIRVSGPSGSCSQYFSRASGSLKSAGPLMVFVR